MASNRSKFIALLALLFVSTFLSVWSFVTHNFHVVSFILISISLISVVAIYTLAQSTERHLGQFIKSLEMADGSFQFNESLGFHTQKKDALYPLLNSINRTLSNIKNQKEISHQLLQHTIENTPIPILVAIPKKNEITIANPSFYHLLGRPVLFAYHDIKDTSITLHSALERSRQMPPTSVLYEKLGPSSRKFSIRCKKTILNGEEHCIFSLLDVQKEISQSEIEAWEKILRVLTHEILNSTQPIATTSERLLSIDDVENNKNMLRNGLSAIYDRTLSLNNFIERYRKLLIAPQLTIRPIKLSYLLERILSLHEGLLKDANISVETPVQEVTISADLELLEQVLINLLKNSIEALIEENKTNPCIVISTSVNGEYQCIYVSDNGPGIPDEIGNDIFTPFFTTKEQGSGLGLSLAYQILSWHNGYIEYVKMPRGAAFKLTLPKI